jgi:cyclopropane-fatty-acyl-phospholipid synthase
MLTSVKNQTDLPRYFAQVFDVAQSLENGRLDLVLDDGRAFRVEGRYPGPVAMIKVHNPDLFARLIREGDLGFSEAYMDGWWTTPDLQALMDLVRVCNDALYDGFPGMALVRAFENMRHRLRGNSKRQARKNIAAHYDLGNDFYRLWLDETMTYLAALFRGGREPLEQAQHQKYESMVDQMGVQPGDHVLEIGCGWGGFAEYAAAERGLRVIGLTISQEQHDYAVERIRAKGLQDRVEIRMQDYRDERGVYDGIAGIEMFEAVGEKYWPTYFQVVCDRLADEVNTADHNTRVWDVVHHQSFVPTVLELALELAMPSLVIWCHPDRVFHISGARLLDDALPASTLATLQNCGHLPMLDQPTEVAELYDNFLQNADVSRNKSTGLKTP